VGFDKRIGIGIGIGAVAVIALIIVAYNSQTYDDARLANLIATYYEDVDRLSVAVILHNADGEFTKANGHLELTIEKNGHQVYSNEYDFTKNDFLTWENIFLGKQRGVLIEIMMYMQTWKQNLVIGKVSIRHSTHLNLINKIRYNLFQNLLNK